MPTASPRLPRRWAGAGGRRYLQLRKLVGLAAGVFGVDELGQQELSELGALVGREPRWKTPTVIRLCISLVPELYRPKNRAHSTLQPPPDVAALVENPRRARGTLLRWPSPPTLTQVPRQQSRSCHLARVMLCDGARPPAPP